MVVPWIDEFFQECIDNGTLSEANALLSHHESSDLMAKVLRESDTAVAIAVTAPATNLALALQREPDLIDRISALFLMGSNYGGGPNPNNVYSWQMTYGGVTHHVRKMQQGITSFQKTYGVMDAEAIQ
mmetsp:Transcript_2575/g.3809  ORF Transcript_2575/g.3809 Transcript_2575/m.3809 type:complete len:128 (-) Transcript_2575:772-1155(-)